jgi:hypothetical protein
MEGICIDTADLRELNSGAVSLYTTQALFSVMLTNYAEKKDANIIAVITQALGTDGSGEQDDIKSIIESNVRIARDFVFDKIDDQCPAEAAPARERRLGNPEQKIEDFLRSNPAKEAKHTASEMGLSGEQVDAVLGNLLKGFSGAETEDINDKLKDAFDDPKVLGDIDKLINADIEKNTDKYATDMAGRLLKEAVNPATGQLESERIREITASLKNFRNLGPSARSLSDLEGGCNSIVESVQGKIKGFIGGLLDKLLSGISEVVGGGDSAFADATSSFGEGASSLLMPLGFVLSMDAVAENGPLHFALGTIIDVSEQAGRVLCQHEDLHNSLTVGLFHPDRAINRVWLPFRNK